LRVINRFNIAGRYASKKSETAKLCTKEYVDFWAKIIRKWRKFLKNEAELLRETLPDRVTATHTDEIF
jgi:hypothetical protein